MPRGDAALRPAAFFDVDGTLAKTTIVDYYVFFRRRKMSPLGGKLWLAAYLVKCLYFIAVDRVNRSKFNEIFYRSYRGLSSAEIKALADACYRTVFRPRRFPQALACIEEHRRANHEIVLVTGSIDFLIQPLADELGIADLLAPSLLESQGRFTGELDSRPMSDGEKARRVRDFAAAAGIDLAHSHAYGDSVTDVAMLEAVGFPHAVNPDRGLARTARARGWSVHRWTLDGDHPG